MPSAAALPASTTTTLAAPRQRAQRTSPVTHRTRPATTSPLLTAPGDARGAALSTFVVQVRRALQSGHPVLVVDESACRDWSPGQRMVLERLRLLADRCGCQWLPAHDGAAAWGGPATGPAGEC